MLLSARAARRAVAGAVGTGAVAGAMLFGAIPSALADDPANNPPNCTAADLAGVASGVSAGTSAYLFTHPDVNWFFTSLEGLPRDEVRKQVADYLDKNPQTKAELTGIRQPLVDLKNRCGAAPAPAIP
ncbi:hemophore-related protein [Mycolicibacterium cosmeticum]|uniref:Exported protein n=1 Tax=Mycolicibacterium cosmeticum TaxID=258533 RepID=W9BKT9_MYCCO|nr:heme-binding protein [Mycolicibacterium cosmeticum]TLH65522.1 hemophore-related protein [Mycolicibacterium cosmeticum]CDO08480.1 exported protein [Mycolicibacterium cosmeticum]